MKKYTFLIFLLIICCSKSYSHGKLKTDSTLIIFCYDDGGKETVEFNYANREKIVLKSPEKIRLGFILGQIERLKKNGWSVVNHNVINTYGAFAHFFYLEK